MPYPSRPIKAPLVEFQGTATTRQTSQQRERLIRFAADRYAEGMSLREIAELTDRSQSAIRRALDQAGIRRRGVGAPAAYERQ